MLNSDFTGCLDSCFQLLPGKKWGVYSYGKGFFPKYLKGKGRKSRTVHSS